MNRMTKKTRELPILFSTPMVQAVQDDRKTMTRRTAGLEEINKSPEKCEFLKFTEYGGRKIAQFKTPEANFFGCLPRYQVGDQLWVKETYTLAQSGICSWIYKADCTYPEAYMWKPSLFMPKTVARIWLEVTDVRCERLQEITQADAIAEGVEFIESIDFNKYKEYTENKFNLRYPIHSFFSLWRKINGKDSVAANPWVFIYEFKRISK